jgi:hypothetical protein
VNIFEPEHKGHIDKGLTQLDAILPKRNFIVHGSTFEIGIGNGAPIAYRIGAPKKNIDYMSEFVRKKESVAHSFTAEQVRQATKDCVECQSRVGNRHSINCDIRGKVGLKAKGK